MSAGRSSRLRAVAALLASPLILAPAAARAEEKPPREWFDLRLGAEGGVFGLLDGGALNRALARAGYSTISPVGGIFGGHFAFEYGRFYGSVGLYGTAFPSASSGLGHRLGLADVGYRVLGRPDRWELIPIVGLGVATTTLAAGPVPAPGARPFAQALAVPSLAELQATNMLVHTGLLFNLFSRHDERDRRGWGVGASAGFVASPLASAWAPATASGTGDGLTGGPHVPATGVFATAHFTLSF